MTRKFRLVQSRAIELAVQLWVDWLNSLERARPDLDWKEDFSDQERKSWAEGLDQELVWNLALSNLDRLALPHIWAGYWIACLVSNYRADDPKTYINIQCPSWAASRTEILFSEELQETTGVGAKRVITSSGPGGSSDNRSVPPVGLEVLIHEPPSSVTVRIPAFLIRGLARDPSPLAQILGQMISESNIGKHPLSQLLHRVGRPLEGEWARKMISEANSQQLRPLYEYLKQSEYCRELVEGLTDKELQRVVKSAGALACEELALGYHAEKHFSKKDLHKIKGRVRKRVNGWFKDAGHWPIPKDEETTEHTNNNISDVTP
jgi:hypothetical protein